MACAGKERTQADAVFVAGAWETVGPVLLASGEGGPFDLVVTSETVYRRTGAAALLALLREIVAPGGTVLLACKVHYFGVADAGGAESWRGLVEADGAFATAVCAHVEEGVGRVVFKHTRK